MTPYIDAIKLMNDFIPVLVAMEKAGMKIDVVELDKLEKECKDSLAQLEPLIREMVQDVMGDTPFNLDSPEQLSQILYSCKVVDKNLWKEVFGIEPGKKKYSRPNYPAHKFEGLLKILTTPIYKTRAFQCGNCKGAGKVQQNKKNGEPKKKPTRCGPCSGAGFIYTTTKDIAGFQVKPLGSQYATVGGFSTSGDVFEELAKTRINENAQTFIKSVVAYNKYTYYLTNVVDGLRKGIREDGAVHSSFMQTIAATGRLSSTNPNLHNQLRGDAFPIRRCFVSRWKEEGGKITDADFNQLEFAVAADMSGCEMAIKAVVDNVDSHSLTKDILCAAGQVVDRQGAKAHTFKPLYGGMSGTEAERTYYKQFLDAMYPGIKQWHEVLCDTAISKGRIVLPSGRVYRFPEAFRYRSGGVSGATKIKNYPVQGTATADVVPIATIELFRAYQKYKFRSLLINEVHDSCITDTHPTELRQVAEVNAEVLQKAAEIFQQRFGYSIRVPLRVEVKQGDNWLDVKKVI